MNSSHHIEISPSAGSPVTCACVAFHHRGQLWVTAIAKATFTLVPDDIVAPAPASEIVVADRAFSGDPSASLRAASDLVPHRPHVDVTFIGHAYAPGGTTGTAAVRLAVFRERALIDKVIHVYGDRERPANDGGSDPAGLRPFDRMPLVYERACASPADNPAGAVVPNLADPHDATRPVSFGPISREWPSRARLLGVGDRQALDAVVPRIPDAFDWRYFQVAPADQQIDALRGDEWIVLDGLHPSLPRLQTRLPSAAAVARIQRGAPSGSGEGERLALVPDTIAIDGDRQSFDMAFRGRFPVPGGEAALSSLRIVIGLELPTRPESLGPARRPSARSPLAGTAIDLRPPSETRPVPAPFPLASPGVARPEAAAVAGAPWSSLPAPPVPKIKSPLAETSLLVDVPSALRASPSPGEPDPPSLPPALPLKGSMYGRPRPSKR